MSQILHSFTNSGPGGFVQTLSADSGLPAVPLLGDIAINGFHGINTFTGLHNIFVGINNAITLGDLVPINPGVPALTLATGDLDINSGNIAMVSTSAGGDDGVINVNGTRFIHNYGAVSNSFFGLSSGNFTLTGFGNTAVGQSTLSGVSSGTFNNAFGSVALNHVSTGTRNVGFGSSALTGVTTGSRNTGIGNASLSALVSGSSNIALGDGSGDLYTGAESNNITIGNRGTVADSARIRIGTNATHTSAFIAGIDGVNVGSVAKVVTMASDQLGTATITAGTGITVTPSANAITISGSGGGVSWSVISADQTAAINHGYFCNKASTLALALPATSAVGDVIEVANENTALGVQFTQAAGQQILIGNTNTTLGATGTLTSSAVGDTLKIVCKTANTIWRVTGIVGNWTVV